MTSAPDMLAAPPTYRASRWPQMSRLERAFAAWLLLRAGWTHTTLPACSWYCTDTDRVLIEYEPGGTARFMVVKWDADDTLARIEAAYGVEARRRAERTIDG